MNFTPKNPFLRKKFRKVSRNRSMLHYYFGDGKGKTSAAAGACIRAAGAGLRCVFAQFHKNGSSSESGMLARLGIDVLAAGDTVKFFKNMNNEEIIRLTAAHNENILKILGGGYGFIVLDELGDAVFRNTVDILLVKKILEMRECEIVVTGHKPVDIFTGNADYLTEFRCIAHPYKNGIKARKGIEY